LAIVYRESDSQFKQKATAMPELYEWPPVRSQRAKWALEELGIAYASHLINLPEGQQDTDAYRAIHPLGAVPALKTDGYTIFESVAIVLQLIDENPGMDLAPAVGTPERAEYYQWSVFACAELDPPIMMYFDNALRPPEFMRPPGRQQDTRLAAHGRSDFAVRATVVSDVLADRDYLVGGRFSGADIVVGHSCFMATHMGLIGDFPVLQAYYERLRERPAHQRAYAG
jgi:glutathione S-transferase